MGFSLSYNYKRIGITEIPEVPEISEVQSIKISGFEDYTDISGDKRSYSKLNGTYKINGIDEEGILAQVGEPGVEWCNLRISPGFPGEVETYKMEYYFAYFGPDESILESIPGTITKDFNNLENWGTFTILFKKNLSESEVITQLITIECNF